MSTYNIAPSEAARRWVSEKGVGGATAEENVQASAWRLVTCAPSWTMAEYRARYGPLFDEQRLEQVFLG